MYRNLADAALTADSGFMPLGRSSGFFEFDRTQCKELGGSLHEAYSAASPYPHIVIDNFVAIDILREVANNFPPKVEGRFSDDFSQRKTGYNLERIRSAYIVDLMNALNSAAFMLFLERLTGIRGLIADAHFTEGGLHETRRGGHLSIHSGFNIHPHTELRRRINLIIFLNENWHDDFGGNLELWDQKMRSCEKSVLPKIGRTVIFNTDSGNFHGHPDALDCPEEITRRSITLYYYTASPSRVIPHTTVFRARPGTQDIKPSFLSQVKDSLSRMRGRRDTGI